MKSINNHHTATNQQALPTETTPLNDINQTTVVSSKMDSETKRVLVKIGFDVVLLCCVGFPIWIYYLFGVPYERGFFCDDESLMHPFHDSTVTSAVLYSTGLLVPIISITIIEFLRFKLKMDEHREVKIFGFEIPFWVQNVYKYVGLLFFGAACSHLTTDIGKYAIGRLRPHFMTRCMPVFPDNTTCADPINLHKYMEVFTCANPKITPRKLKEMRLSFPSGHSSFSMYTMVFAALYLHSRFNWKGSKLMKHFLQFTFIAMAWYVAMSRISDYKHHWSDVLAGSLQGLVVCLLIIFGVSDLYKKRWQSRSSKYEMNPQIENGTRSE